MTDKRRRTVLFAALASVLAWSLWVAISGDDPDNGAEGDLVAEHVDNRKERPRNLTQSRIPSTAALATSDTRLALDAATVNLFPKQTWYIPPPPPPPPPPRRRPRPHKLLRCPSPTWDAGWKAARIPTT